MPQPSHSRHVAAQHIHDSCGSTASSTYDESLSGDGEGKTSPGQQALFDKLGRVWVGRHQQVINCISLCQSEGHEA